MGASKTVPSTHPDSFPEAGLKSTLAKVLGKAR